LGEGGRRVWIAAAGLSLKFTATSTTAIAAATTTPAVELLVRSVLRIGANQIAVLILTFGHVQHFKSYQQPRDPNTAATEEQNKRKRKTEVIVGALRDVIMTALPAFVVQCESPLIVVPSTPGTLEIKECDLVRSLIIWVVDINFGPERCIEHYTITQ
jgi:hypothetical protein